jgi:ATP-dependent DNA ligase
MECHQVAAIPEGENWQYELKLDGYRAIAIKQAKLICFAQRKFF